MLTIIWFVIWIGCFVLLGWLANRRGRAAAHWVALALVPSFVLYLTLENYNQPQWGTTAGGSDGWVYPLSVAPEALAFLPPLLALGLLALLSNRNRKRCPDCGETIQAAARVCRYCRRELDHAARLPGNLA